MITDWTTKIIEEHKKTFDDNNLRDFIDAFIAEERKENDNSFTVGIFTICNALQCHLI